MLALTSYAFQLYNVVPTPGCQLEVEPQLRLLHVPATSRKQLFGAHGRVSSTNLVFRQRAPFGGNWISRSPSEIQSSSGNASTHAVENMFPFLRSGLLRAKEALGSFKKGSLAPGSLG